MNRFFKKLPAVIAILLVLTMLASGITGCKAGSTGTNTTTATSAATSTTTSSAALTIVKGDETKTLTMAQIKDLPVVSGSTGDITSSGTIEGPNSYKGASLADILKSVGGIGSGDAIRISAKDGYSMTLSYKQAIEGAEFPTYDSTTGKEAPPAGTITVFLVYEKDGTALDDTVGPLRLGIMAPGQVTDGHWWIKWAQKIQVVAVQQSFDLKLSGAEKTDVDSSTFESCSAAVCHGTNWTDAQGRTWTGVPLWYFAGKVDDVTDSHDGDSYNTAMADAGAYDVQVNSSDGTSATFTSKQVKQDDNLIVAYRIGGVALPSNQWPLALVGKDVSAQQQISKITSINLIFKTTTTTDVIAPTATTATSTTAAGPTILTVTKGSSSKTYSLADLKALPAVSGYAGQLGKNNTVNGPYQYAGVALSSLLNAVGGISAGNSVKVTASDGYSQVMSYQQLTNNSFTLFDSATGQEATTSDMTPVVFLAYSKDGAALDQSTGPLQLGIMTCQNRVTQGQQWVKMVVKIEVVSG
ncbi:MAG TPA: hypothetical protein VEI27_02390 [Dehalococcoidales bacterium]|nr:hypothetical protein [Dehalococcoidales bacterium]